MSVIDLHPEELFDKEARGELTAAERTRFDAHLGQCAACRAERRLRLDFADERGNDLIEDAHFSSELVAIALGSAKAKAKEEPKKAPSLRPSRPRRIARAWMLAAAALMAVTAAAANQASSGSWLRRATGIDPPSSLQTSDVTTKHVAPPPPPPVAVTAAPPPAPVETAPVIEEKPAPTPVMTAVPVQAPAPVSTAATIFDEANEARRRGDYARAIELHRQLQTRHPASREAQVSRATLGRLLLDRGDLVGALASFDDYQAHGHGELDEAVMVGRATALDRLGRTAEARRAWQALLVAFPSSPYAEHARARVGTPEE